MSAGWIKLVLTAASCLDKFLHKAALSVLLSCHKSSHHPSLPVSWNRSTVRLVQMSSETQAEKDN